MLRDDLEGVGLGGQEGGSGGRGICILTADSVIVQQKVELLTTQIAKQLYSNKKLYLPQINLKNNSPSIY